MDTKATHNNSSFCIVHLMWKHSWIIAVYV